MSQSILESNLNALSAHNAALANQLRSASSACSSLEFEPTPQGVPFVRLNGTQLSSRHRPLEEAQRWADEIDIRANAVVAVLGFGAGYHVGALAQRMQKTGVIVIFEPDVALLRGVFERIDHAKWMRETNIVFVTDPEDKPALASQLHGAEGLIAQGTTICAHGPSVRRLGEQAGAFGKMFAQLVGTMRTTIATTLVHAATTCRNLCLNMDQYSAGHGIGELEGIAKGRPAILVAAGPSLSLAMDRLADEAIRERAIIIAVQTCLRPLVRRGIRPHFVTALDYHEISAQFYDDLDPDDLRDVTLVCEAKVNRHVIESFPGSVRCVGNSFLDRLLGPVKRPMGTLASGSTVAHLSFYLAQYLGCDPIVFAGQDLAFTDNLYYGPDAAIHDQWAVELNRFNTIEMMEWSRVARMKRNLRRHPGCEGGEVFIDEQMATYLTQFERDFAKAPQTIIDTSLGARKAHTTVKSIAEVAGEVSRGPELPEIPITNRALNQGRIARTRRRLMEVRSDAQRLIELSERTAGTLNSMLTKQHDAAEMTRLFKTIEELRAKVDRLSDVYELVTLVNQLGVFKRLKADRQLELDQELSPIERQRGQLERDLANVRWIIDASTEFVAMINESLAVLDGQHVDGRINPNRVKAVLEEDGITKEAAQNRVAAMMWVDSERSGLNRRRSLDAAFGDRTVLDATLARVDQIAGIDSIVLLHPKSQPIKVDVEALGLRQPVIVRGVDDASEEETRRAIAAARAWSATSWRGGIGGMSVYDEVIHPRAMAGVMAELDLDAVVVVGADWPLVDPSAGTGCQALIDRYREAPESHRIVFTQSPPGLCGCLVARSLMDEMAREARQFTIGAMLSYIPALPQLDPMTKDACVKVPAAVRNDHGRYTMDSPGCVARLLRCLDENAGVERLTGTELIQALRCTEDDPARTLTELTIDLDGATMEGVGHVLKTLEQPEQVALSIGQSDDALESPLIGDVVKLAREVGIGAVHVRTNLLGGIDAGWVLSLDADVISVNLFADTAASYRQLTGRDRFGEVIANIEKLINTRNARLNDGNALARPWIVPRMVRAACTLSEQQNFVDRWIHLVGAAIVESDERGPVSGLRNVIAVPTPEGARQRIEGSSLRIDGQGRVAGFKDAEGLNAFAMPMDALWAQVCELRRAGSEEERAATDEFVLTISAA